MLASSWLSVRLSIRPSAWNNSAPTGRIFMKFYIRVFFENLSRISKFHQYTTRISGTLRADRYTFWSHLGQFFLEWEFFSDKSCIEIKTHILRDFFVFKIIPVWDNVERYSGAGQATNDNIACWIWKAKIHHHNMYYLLLFCRQNGWINAPQCYVIRTLSLLLKNLYCTCNAIFSCTLMARYKCKRRPSCIYFQSNVPISA